MSRAPKTKILIRTRLGSKYGSWFYCENCGKSIGYLCYVTYDSFKFNYRCKCGGQGSMHIDFQDVSSQNTEDRNLIVIKNRRCCPIDNSPLFTILENNLDSYHYEVACNKCKKIYLGEKRL